MSSFRSAAPDRACRPMSKVPPSPAQASTVVSLSPCMSRAARIPEAVAAVASNAMCSSGTPSADCGHGPGDDGPAARRQRDDGLGPEGLQHEPHGEAAAAARAGHVPGSDQLALRDLVLDDDLAHGFTPTQMSSRSDVLFFAAARVRSMQSTMVSGRHVAAAEADDVAVDRRALLRIEVVERGADLLGEDAGAPRRDVAVEHGDVRDASSAPGASPRWGRGGTGGPSRAPPSRPSRAAGPPRSASSR